jgi:two-component system NtrC family response regulator
MSSSVEAALAAYNWPGNIRELQNVVEGMVTLALEEPELHPVHLPVHIRVHVARGQVRERDVPDPLHSSDEPRKPLPRLKVYRQAMDRLYLEQLLDQSGGRPQEACRISGMSRSRLYALLKEHGMKLLG